MSTKTFPKARKALLDLLVGFEDGDFAKVAELDTRFKSVIPKLDPSKPEDRAFLQDLQAAYAGLQSKITNLKHDTQKALKDYQKTQTATQAYRQVQTG